jgi:hypothetical protein
MKFELGQPRARVCGAAVCEESVNRRASGKPRAAEIIEK